MLLRERSRNVNTFLAPKLIIGLSLNKTIKVIFPNPKTVLFAVLSILIASTATFSGLERRTDFRVCGFYYCDHLESHSDGLGDFLLSCLKFL